jgi:hypothetical protein
MLRIECPNCHRTLTEDISLLTDGTFFICPQTDCQAEVTITMTWVMPPDHSYIPPVPRAA